MRDAKCISSNLQWWLGETEKTEGSVKRCRCGTQGVEFTEEAITAPSYPVAFHFCCISGRGSTGYCPKDEFTEVVTFFFFFVSDFFYFLKPDA